MISSQTTKIKIDQEEKWITRPKIQEDSMDLLWQKHQQDEDYFPYWLADWSASFALYVFFCQKKLELGRVIEVGCGNGTLAQLSQGMSGVWHHADLVSDAVCFAREHGPVERFYSVFDIRFSPFSAKFDTILATEFSYEDHLVKAFVDFCKQNLAKNGCAYLCESVKAGREGNFTLLSTLWMGSVEQREIHFELNGHKRTAKLFLLRH